MGNLRSICGLDLAERDNLDAEMAALVKGIEKKYGFMPHFVRLFATDNKRLRAFMGQYLELMRDDSGLTHLEHEMIALVSAATNGCVYCTSHHGALMRAETGDTLFAEYLSRNYKLADLTPRHRAMLDFVVKVLRDAEAIEDADRDALRAVGFDGEFLRRRQPHRPGQRFATGPTISRHVSGTRARGTQGRLNERRIMRAVVCSRVKPCA